MLQEDSNGETTFEIIDKRTEELSLNCERTDVFSSHISPPNVPMNNIGAGNILSNVPPPAALPSFIPPVMAPPPTSGFVPASPATVINPVTPPQPSPANIFPATPPQPTPVGMYIPEEAYYPTQFSAAIPPSKGVHHGAATSNIPLSLSEDSGGLINWMKGAVASGGILSKVAEKAKNSVDSMIITLDPQMKGYIYSGGDVNILVASTQDVKVNTVQEAFQVTFGKATIYKEYAQATNIAIQPVGITAGLRAAEERIQAVFKLPNYRSMPVVAIENFLLDIEGGWFDLGVLMLNDPVRQINLHTFTQMTPVPSSVVSLAQEDTPADYPLKSSGLAVPIGGLMARNLGVNHAEWHQALTGVSRREIILLAAKTLASLYKRSIDSSSPML